MTIIARRIASVPARSGVDTWAAIVDLIAPNRESEARKELEEAAGVAYAVIASEVSAPFVIYGSGPRIRIYCVYGDDALLGDDVNENPLPHDPTEGDWHLSIPCPKEDLEWTRRKVDGCERVSIRAEDETVAENEGRSTSASREFNVDREAFFRG